MKSTKKKLTAWRIKDIMWLVANKYFRDAVSHDGVFAGFEVVEDREPAITVLQSGDEVGIATVTTFAYVRDVPLTEPWEETTRTSTSHIAIAPTSPPKAKVLIECVAILLVR